jgi:tetratricopeptide (TPR) repeat protein
MAASSNGYPRWEIEPAAPLSYLPGLFLVGLSILFWYSRRSWGRACLFGLGYFILALSPALGVLNMTFLTLSRVADHFQYLALPRLMALVVANLCWATRHAPRSTQPLSFILLLLLLLLPLSLLSWRYQRLVGNPEALWRDNIAKNPNSWPARNNLAQILAGRKQFKEAEEQCRAALANQTDAADSHYNLGNALLHQNKIDEAIRALSEAVRLQPENAAFHNGLDDGLHGDGN